MFYLKSRFSIKFGYASYVLRVRIYLVCFILTVTKIISTRYYSLTVTVTKSRKAVDAAQDYLLDANYVFEVFACAMYTSLY